MRRNRRPFGPQDGFNMLEVTLALSVLSVGLVSILAVFPAAFSLQLDMVMDTRGAAVAKDAAAFLEGDQVFSGGVASYVLDNDATLGAVNAFVWPNSGGAPDTLDTTPPSGLDQGLPNPPDDLQEVNNDLGPDRRFYWRAFLRRPPDVTDADLKKTLLDCRIDVWFVSDPGNANSYIRRVGCYHTRIRAK